MIYNCITYIITLQVQTLMENIEMITRQHLNTTSLPEAVTTAVFLIAVVTASDVLLSTEFWKYGKSYHTAFLLAMSH